MPLSILYFLDVYGPYGNKVNPRKMLNFKINERKMWMCKLKILLIKVVKIIFKLKHVSYGKELWWYLKLTITLECGSSKFSFFNVRSISIQLFADARSSNNGLGIPCSRLSTLVLIPGFGAKARGSTSFSQKAFGQQAFIRQSLQSKQPWLSFGQ